MVTCSRSRWRRARCCCSSGSALGILFAWGAVTLLPTLAPDLLPRLGDIRDRRRRASPCTTLVAAVVAGGVRRRARCAEPRGRAGVDAARRRPRGDDRPPQRPAASDARGRAGGDGDGAARRLGTRAAQLPEAARGRSRVFDPMASSRSGSRCRRRDTRRRRTSPVSTTRCSIAFARCRASTSPARRDGFRSPPTFAEIDPLRLEGRTPPPNVLPPLAEMRVATPGYFEAMGIPLVAGRTLERSDTERQTGAVLVTQTIVRKVMEWRPPVGARVAHGLAGVRDERPWSDVVGVVGDVRGVSLDKEPVGAVYYAMINRPGVDMDWLARSMVYAVRTKLPPASLVAAARRELAQLDPTLPLAETRTLSSVVEAAQSGMRFSMIGFAVAAVIGLFMGAIGLYGVLSYVTAQRTREIGVRMALGATPSSVRVAILRRGVVGERGSALPAGLVAAVSLRVLAKPLLYGITPTDPLTLVLVIARAAARWRAGRVAAGSSSRPARSRQGAAVGLRLTLARSCCHLIRV